MGKYTIPPNQDWRKKQAQALLDFIEGMNYEGRNPWEMDFLISIKQQSAEGKQLTDKQLEKLQEVYRSAANDL